MLTLCSPCCCALKYGTKVVAIMQIIGSILGMWVIYSGPAPRQKESHSELDYGSDGSDKKSVSAGIYILFIILPFMTFLCQLFLGVFLLIGSIKRDIRKCRIWLNLYLALTVVSIIFFFGSIYTATAGISFIIPIPISLYYLWVVHDFIDELKAEADSNSSYTV